MLYQRASRRSGYDVKPLEHFLVINEYCFDTLYISNYFVCKKTGECKQSLTDIEIEHGITPVWVDLDKAIKIFSDYPNKREDIASLYLREYTVLNKLKTKYTNKIKDKQITIEPLNPDDYHKCSNIWNMKAQPLADKWLYEIRTGNRLVFIYKINGDFIGEGALVFDTGDPDYTIPNRRVYVSRMIVKKEFRNRGIGSEILAFLIKKATEMGFKEITIGVDKDNVNALHMYKKHGFTEVLFDGADENGEYFKLIKRI